MTCKSHSLSNKETSAPERISRFLTYWCGVALQVTVNLAQVDQIRLLHKTCLCPGSIQDRCGMTLKIECEKSDGVTKSQSVQAS